MQPGDEWIYRLRDYAPSERVLIVELHPRKRSPRATIEYLGGERQGETENVPGTRLRGPWAGVEAYDQLMANWARFAEFTLTEPEMYATETVYDLLIPTGVAVRAWNPVRYATAVYDRAALERLTTTPIDDLLADVHQFDHDGALWVSPEGTLHIAEAACRANSTAVLSWVDTDEREKRHASKHGRKIRGLDGSPDFTTPEWEYEYYLEHHRPLHEILRQWCGHRAVSLHERLMAAEAEVNRLDELLARYVDALQGNGAELQAKFLSEEHERDRITPYNVRPLVERPLRPDEIPERIVYRNRRWW